MSIQVCKEKQIEKIVDVFDDNVFHIFFKQ